MCDLRWICYRRCSPLAYWADQSPCGTTHAHIERAPRPTTTRLPFDHASPGSKKQCSFPAFQIMDPQTASPLSGMDDSVYLTGVPTGTGWICDLQTSSSH